MLTRKINRFFFYPKALITSGPEICSDHEDNFLFIVDLIEKSVISYPVAPGFRFVCPQFFYVFPEVGLLPELGIDIFPELDNSLFLWWAKNLFKVALKLVGFEDSKFSQQNGLSFFWLVRYRL